MSAFSEIRDKDYSTVTDLEKCLLEVWEQQGLEHLAENGAVQLAALQAELAYFRNAFRSSAQKYADMVERQKA